MNISELRRLEAEATPGPWEITPCWDILGNTDHGNGMVCQITPDVPYTEAEANAALIVAIRNTLPELLDQLEKAIFERGILFDEVERLKLGDRDVG